MAGYVCIRLQGSREDNPNLFLLQDVAHPVENTGLGAAVGNEFEAERCHIVHSALFGITYVQLKVVGSINGKGIGGGWAGQDVHGINALFMLAQR
jgi:hypothetical protein